MTEKENFFTRLDVFIVYKNINDNQLEKQTGISNGLIGKGRKRGALGLKNITKILKTYKNLNPNWLLTGNGEMFLDNQQLKILPTVILNNEQKESINKLFYSYMELATKINQIDLTSTDIKNIKEIINK